MAYPGKEAAEISFHAVTFEIMGFIFDNLI
ncbi:Uncharacterised protein [Enterobacter hormaechei]|nr:Uncharacterised protein [Enterobacter hormaechei]